MSKPKSEDQPTENEVLLKKNTPIIKKSKGVEKKAKSGIDINAEASFTYEEDIKLGDYEEAPSLDDIDITGWTFNDLRQLYKDNGGDVSQVDGKITDYLSDNKDNSDIVRKFMSNFLLGTKEGYYDSNKNTNGFGNTTEEILSNLLSAPEGEVLPGWVCSNIHDLGMRYLHKANFESAVVSCKSQYGAGHAILLYKSGEGEYTFMNYGSSEVLEAKTMKEAVCMLQKNKSELMSNGTICFVDENGSYCEYALKDDAVWGEKIDKSSHNSQMPEPVKIPERSKIDASFDYTNLGDKKVTIEGAKVFGKGTKFALTGGLGYQTNSNSQIFQNSKSFGGEVGIKGSHSTSNGTNYFGAEVIENYVQAEYKPIVSDTGVRKQEAEYLTTYARGVAGTQEKVDLSDNISLTNTAQVSAEGYLVAGITLGTSFNGDGRLALEDGIKLNTKIDNVTLENALSAGLLVDMRKTSGAQEIGAQLGSKFNASGSIIVNNDKDLSFGASIDGYSVFTPSATDYGVGAKTFVTYKPDDEVSIIGGAGIRYDYQQMNIGGMREFTENRGSFNVSVSAKRKKDMFTLSCGGNFNNINASRNNSRVSFGYTRNF